MRGSPAVAPLVGAWIETTVKDNVFLAFAGRPSRGGVDRNLCHSAAILRHFSSPLSWGRGSKLYRRPLALGEFRSPLSWGRGSKQQRGHSDRRNARSPLSWGRGSKHWRGAEPIESYLSPLSWGRGSKRVRDGSLLDKYSSPLSWGRGSKQFRRGGVCLCGHVAPLVGAWIETIKGWRRRLLAGCRPSRGGVDRN